MCGIVGYLGEKPVVPLLVDGLQKLGYRGYDSAGVVVRDNGELRTIKAEGKIDQLAAKLASTDLEGSYGLGHTRWATHGVPSERNAHPLNDSAGSLALIHNGIIENFLPLKKRLAAEGWSFVSDTDTEVIVNLVSSHYEDDLVEAVRKAVAELEGMYAFAVISKQSDEEEIVAARHGPPLVLGLGEGENFLASDPSALLAHTKDVIFLENGDIARLSAPSIEVWSADGERADRAVVRLDWNPIQAEKRGFKHFMLKEIHEQPQAIQETFSGRVDFERGTLDFDTLELTGDEVRAARRIHLLACGTSWHAALVGQFLIEELVGIPVEVDYGSEYRYRNPLVYEGDLAVGISQSGETADTVSAMEAAREKGAKLISMCNVLGSQTTRMADGVIYTQAGPEIGVASTKAFTTQLTALYLLALYLRQQLGMEPRAELMADLAHLPGAVGELLARDDEFEQLTGRYSEARDFLYIGRGLNYPIALEGALKLKEISYIHAEGYPAGEMKHGPIALIDRNLPVVALATGERVFDKMLSNMQEVRARDGIVIAVTDRDESEIGEAADEVIQVPRVSELLQPVVNVIPLQLFAYYMAVRRGADVDQPRNLAKSVTVE